MAEKKKKHTTSKKKKQRAPFFPNSPSCVGSPTNNGEEITRRTVRQLTPQKLCSLALPPPLLSLFDADGSIAALGGDEHSVGNQVRHQSKIDVRKNIGFCALVFYAAKFALCLSHNKDCGLKSLLKKRLLD